MDNDGKKQALTTFLKKQDRMRIGMRWLYRNTDYQQEYNKRENYEEWQRQNPEDAVSDNPVPNPGIPEALRNVPWIELKNRELLMTDYMSGPVCNSLTTVDDIACLFSSEKEMDDFVRNTAEADRARVQQASYFCNKFYWATEVDKDLHTHILEKFPTQKRVRPLPPEELVQMTSSDSISVSDEYSFWNGRKKKKKPKMKRSSARKITQQRGPVQGLSPNSQPDSPNPDAASVFAAEQQMKLNNVRIEDVLSSEQLNLVRQRMRQLTPEQSVALHDNLRSLTRELMRQYAGGVAKNRRDFEQYPAERKGAVSKACDKYWDMVRETEVVMPRDHGER